jgi:hypothetical protein
MPLYNLWEISEDAPPLLGTAVLGVKADVPGRGQPAVLADGIHIRWAVVRPEVPYKNKAGFPEYGFYLFRRKAEEGTPSCLGAALVELGLPPGPQPGKSLATKLGTLSSDASLVLSDDFPESGVPEVDLESRSWVQLALGHQYIAKRVKVSIGFRADYPPAGGGDDSDPGRGGKPVPGADCPCLCQDSADVVPYVHDVIDLGNGLFRATFGYNNPGKASSVIPRGRENAVSPSSLGAKPPSLFYGGDHSRAFRVDFDGKPIAWRLGRRVAVATGEMARRGGEGDGLIVVGLRQGFPVVRQVVSGQKGQIQQIELIAPAIDTIRVSGGPARLVNVCIVPVMQNATVGWAPVPQCQQPIFLPAASGVYGDRLTDMAAAWNVAKGRIKYGTAATWQDPDQPSQPGPAFVDLHNLLIKMIAQASASTPIDYVDPAPVPAEAEAGDDPESLPSLAEHHWLDTVLVASTEPAIAQMLGLYWIDATAAEGTDFEYLVVADYDNLGNKNPATILQLLANEGFLRLHAFMTEAVAKQGATALAAPQQVKAYRLPMGTPISGDPAAAGDVGLVWDLGYDSVEGGNAGQQWKLRRDQPIGYHLWRADLHDSKPGAAVPELSHLCITSEAGIGVSLDNLPEDRPATYPAFPLYTIDYGLKEGWYSYRLSAFDLFGRHSGLSAPAAWQGWQGEPVIPGDAAPPYQYGIRVQDLTPPPPPCAVEAHLLDPQDPFLLKGPAYDEWRKHVSGDLIGLRVRWAWTPLHMLQAPDTKEFRIYFHPDPENSTTLFGNITAISAAGDGETDVTTDIPETSLGDREISALQIGGKAFVFVSKQTPASSTDPRLTLRVRNRGAKTDQRPPASSACAVTLKIDPQKSPFRSPSGWHERFHVVPIGESYSQVGLSGDAATSEQVDDISSMVTLDGDASLETVLAMGEILELEDVEDNTPTEFPILEVDEGARTLRVAGVPQLTGSSSKWAIHNSSRIYEVFLPDPNNPATKTPQLSLDGGRAIRYAFVGISSADDKPKPPDPREQLGATTDQPFASRRGNEGSVGGPIRLARIKRGQPAAPTLPTFPDDSLLATPADFDGNSFFTLHFPKQAGYGTHVFRVLDETLFKADSAKRFANPPKASANVYPSEWSQARREAAAREIAGLTATNYGTLHSDALRVLASLTSNQDAFTQLTAAPLEAASHSDQRGPDDPPDYTPSSDRCSYVDTLDGRAQNKYFYRTAVVDQANNPPSPLGISTPPVCLPMVTVLSPPRLTNVTGSDGAISLQWTSPPGEGQSQYKVYRADSEAAALDLRTMTVLATVPASVSASQTSYVDNNAPALQTLFYRVVAVNAAGAQSPPSAIMSGRALRLSAPAAPALISVQRVAGPPPAVRLTWTIDEPLEVNVQRREVGGDPIWRAVSDWLPTSTTSFNDSSIESGLEYAYRLRGRDQAGVLSDLGIPMSTISSS